jgi:hypothetical protein
VARKNKLAKAGEAAWAAQGDRYMQRLLEDEELRSSLLGAYTAARSAYGRLSNGKGPTDALFHDPKLQQELIQAATALREATGSLTETSTKQPRRKPSGKRRSRGPRRSLLLIAVGAALAIALSEELRSKVLDALFGAEEEFDYTSTTAPATPAPAGVAGS